MLRRVLAVLLLSMPVFAQYAGPAILSRDEAPAGMQAPQISFRPYFDINATYDTGLAGVGTNSQGQLANMASTGVQAAGGISGMHSWKHTKLGLDYHGSVYHYFKQTYYDNSNHSLLLSFEHQFTRHLTLTLAETAGMYSRDFGLLGLAQTVAFDPAQQYVPTTDYFDNRTLYAVSQAQVIYQKTARLSFDLGGDFFLVRRRSTALAAVTGATAQADIEYRLTRRTTVGVNYQFNDFSYAHTYSGTDAHTGAISISTRLSRWVELSLFGGATRMETKYVQSVPVDPAITALLGITTGVQLVYRVNYVPTFSGRLARSFQHGVAYIEGKRAINPGNGLFLTSNMTTVMAGYTYTGIRHWSFNLMAGFDQAQSVMNFIGRYGDYRGGFTASRQLAHSIHAIAGFTANQYHSPDFPNYNRMIYDARVGFGFAPGDVPVRIW